MEDKGEASSEKVIHEGKAKITFPNSNEVFYNPVQVFNRDLSVACIQVYADEIFPLTSKVKKSKAKGSVNKEINEEEMETVQNIDKSGTGSSQDGGTSHYLIQYLKSSLARMHLLNSNPFFTASNCDYPGMVLLEGLAASGLRSIRYALEVKGIEKIIANDISADAVKLMSRNIQENEVSHLVSPFQMDARFVWPVSTNC